MAGVRVGEKAGPALLRRHKYHLCRPVAWLKCARVKTVTLTSVGRVVHKDDALADEAVEAARQIMADPRRCRGGPWSLPGAGGNLPTHHTEEVRLVNHALRGASTLAQKRAAVRTVDGMALKAHLQRRRFAAREAPRRAKKVQRSGAQNRIDYKKTAAAEARYARSAKGKASKQACEERYARSAKGKASQQRRNEKRRS